jgi:hypothetical protein
MIMADELVVNRVVSPAGTGCVECLASGGWWLHLRRCANGGHIGCCGKSPSQDAARAGCGLTHQFREGFKGSPFVVHGDVHVSAVSDAGELDEGAPRRWSESRDDDPVRRGGPKALLWRTALSIDPIPI